MNSILLEFEGQLSIADIQSLTKKELYYLRMERKMYNDKLREQTDKAIQDAQQNQQQTMQQKRTKSVPINQNMLRSAQAPRVAPAQRHPRRH